MYRPKTLITRVSAFAGRKLAHKLMQDGHTVIGADLHPCLELEGLPHYAFQPLDLTKWESVSELNLDGVDAVVHLAAAGVEAATRQWPLCIRVNVEGTPNLVRKLLVDSYQLSDTASPIELELRT